MNQAPTASSVFLEQFLPVIGSIGPVSFGTVIGWLAHASYASESKTTITWLAGLLGAIAGGAVTTVFREPNLFNLYCFGLGIGFFGRALIFKLLPKGEPKPPTNLSG